MKHRGRSCLWSKAYKTHHPSRFLLEELTARGWTIRELARRMEGDARRNAALLWHWLRHPTGDLELGNNMVARIADALGISAEPIIQLEVAWVAARKVRRAKDGRA